MKHKKMPHLRSEREKKQKTIPYPTLIPQGQVDRSNTLFCISSLINLCLFFILSPEIGWRVLDFDSGVAIDLIRTDLLNCLGGKNV